MLGAQVGVLKQAGHIILCRVLECLHSCLLPQKMRRRHFSSDFSDYSSEISLGYEGVLLSLEFFHLVEHDSFSDLFLVCTSVFLFGGVFFVAEIESIMRPWDCGLSFVCGFHLGLNLILSLFLLHLIALLFFFEEDWFAHDCNLNLIFISIFSRYNLNFCLCLNWLKIS